MSSARAASAVAGGESAATIEGLAEALYLTGEYTESAAHYERAYGAYRRGRDVAAAGRCARILGWITGNVLGEWAVQGGWFGRARSNFEQAGTDRPEHGWVLFLTACGEPEPAVREGLVREAIAVGRRYGDADLELESLAFLGAHLVATNEVEKGLALLDEALAGTCAGELTDVTLLDSIFCLFFSSCELVNDVARAEQWMRAAEETLRRRGVLAAYCRAHYGVRGRCSLTTTHARSRRSCHVS